MFLAFIILKSTPSSICGVFKQMLITAPVDLFLKYMKFLTLSLGILNIVKCTVVCPLEDQSLSVLF